MDNCIAAVAAAVAAYLRFKQIIQTIAQWVLVQGLLDKEGAINRVPGRQDNKSSVVFATCRIVR